MSTRKVKAITQGWTATPSRPRPSNRASLPLRPPTAGGAVCLPGPRCPLREDAGSSPWLPTIVPGCGAAREMVPEAACGRGPRESLAASRCLHERPPRAEESSRFARPLEPARQPGATSPSTELDAHDPSGLAGSSARPAIAAPRVGTSVSRHERSRRGLRPAARPARKRPGPLRHAILPRSWSVRLDAFPRLPLSGGGRRHVARCRSRSGTESR